MTASLLTLLLLAQAPSEGTPAPEAAPAPADAAPAPAEATPAEAAPAPAETQKAEPAPAPAEQPAADAAVPRASNAPMSETNREALIGRIVSGVVLATGAVLLVIGTFGLGSAALIQFAPVLKEDYPTNENPRRTMGTLASAVAAGGLMLGAVCVLGGLFGVLVG